ncbi:efflux RND transporter permease subunit [Thalassoglobus sp. JC818]|uniref:efflux RND transporter permease subunit n=1 Tax=Thalassoglobus sp. JC818 TaxID=3232136 RepID=UPI00345A9498
MSLPKFSVENPVFVNMMMIVTLVAGFGFALTLVREMFPESRPNKISITAIYPATQPEELERAVTIKVEEAVRDVDGIEKINSTVSEGMSLTTLTLYNSVKDVDVVMQEVKNEVDSLQDLPDDLEKISIAKMEPTLPVIMVSVFGDGDERSLKQAARDIKDDLLQLPGVSDVQLSGIRDDEISVEVQPDRLIEYNLTLDQIAQAIRQTNLDVSGGNLKGERGQVAVKTLGEKQTGIDLEEIEILALPDGRTLKLADVAVIRDEFIDTDVMSYWEGKRSATLTVQKTPSQDAIQISTLVKAYVAGKMGEDFDPDYAPGSNPGFLTRVSAGLSRFADSLAGRPDPMTIYEESRNNPFQHNFSVATHNDLARFVEGRLDLMLRNGKSGLLLVLISLVLFLNWRVAFWTAVGLPISFLGTFIVMAMMGVSINLLSMFGLIIVLGIIVDDAIVIGENIYRRVEEGMPAYQAAIRGAEEVQWPVTAAVCTTIAAFLPLMFIRGQIGDFFRELPLVVIAALSVSLVEALIILPAHLSHLPPHKDHRKEKPRTGLLRYVSMVGAAQQRFIETLMDVYSSILRVVLKWRYLSLAVAVSLCMMTLGLFFGAPPAPQVADQSEEQPETSDGEMSTLSPGNIVKWEFIQKMDAESMIAQIELPVGSNTSAVEERLRRLSDAATKMPEVDGVAMDVAVMIDVNSTGGMGVELQSHVGQLWIELMAADEREQRGLRSSQEVLAELRAESEKLTGINSITWQLMSGGPGGKDIEIRLTGRSMEELEEIVEDFKAQLSTYAGVVDLGDDFDDGRREVQLSLRPSARSTGITKASLGQSVRAATYGVEARRITRNREEVKIMVRYPRDFREDVFHIESLWIPTPANQDGVISWVPIQEVAEIEETRGFTQIHRSQLDRAMTITGDVDTLIASPTDIIGRIKNDYLPKLQKEYPGIRVEFLGSSEEQGKSFSSLTLAMPVALLMIYMMLAALFRSYFQPLVVMSAIPFGIQGAIIGHWITDNPMTILSAIGLIALTGIVVNDSLVLVDFINKRIREGMSEFAASIDGARLRLRPILLTTVTTAAGLTPMMFEKSFQAKFLIPMAVTLTFGLIFATALTLIIVPVLNMIFFDVRSLIRKLSGEIVPGLQHSDLVPTGSASVVQGTTDVE